MLTHKVSARTGRKPCDSSSGSASRSRSGVSGPTSSSDRRCVPIGAGARGRGIGGHSERTLSISELHSPALPWPTGGAPDGSGRYLERLKTLPGILLISSRAGARAAQHADATQGSSRNYGIFLVPLLRARTDKSCSTSSAGGFRPRSTHQSA
jgi:hypothetical protein